MTFNLELICKDAAKKLSVELKSLPFEGGVFEKYCKPVLGKTIPREKNPDFIYLLENWSFCRKYSRSVDARGSEVCYEGKNEEYLFVYAKLIEKDSKNVSESLYIKGKDRQICFFSGVNGATDFMRIEDDRLANLLEEFTGLDRTGFRSEFRSDRRDVFISYIKLKHCENVNQATVDYVAKILE